MSETNWKRAVALLGLVAMCGCAKPLPPGLEVVSPEEQGAKRQADNAAEDAKLDAERAATLAGIQRDTQRFAEAIVLS